MSDKPKSTPAGMLEFLNRMKEDADKNSHENQALDTGRRYHMSGYRANKSKQQADWVDAHRYYWAGLPLDNMKLNANGNWNPSPYIWDDTSETEQPKSAPTCEHNFVDVGFNFTKFVCSKCDAEKGE